MKFTTLAAPVEQVNDATGGSPSGAHECEIESVAALALVTVRVTVQGPAFAYGWLGGFCVTSVDESPRFHDQDTAFVEVSVNDSSWTVAVAAQLNAATGGGGGAVGGAVGGGVGWGVVPGLCVGVGVGRGVGGGPSVITGIGVGVALIPLLASTGGPTVGIGVKLKPVSSGPELIAIPDVCGVGLPFTRPSWPGSRKRAARRAMTTKIRIVAESRQRMARRFEGAVRIRAGVAMAIRR